MFTRTLAVTLNKVLTHEIILLIDHYLQKRIKSYRIKEKNLSYEDRF